MLLPSRLISYEAEAYACTSPESRKNLDYRARLAVGTAGPRKSQFVCPEGLQKNILRLSPRFARGSVAAKRSRYHIRRFVSLRLRQRGPATVYLSLDGIYVARVPSRLLGQGSVIYCRAKKVHLLLRLSVLLLGCDLSRLPILRMRHASLASSANVRAVLAVPASFLDSYVRCSDSGRAEEHPSRTG